MTLSLLFWILMLFWVLFRAWTYWPRSSASPSFVWGGDILLFILFLVLGWAVFGTPIRG